MTKAPMAIYGPTADPYIVHAYTWPTVYAREHARVITFRVKSEVPLMRLPELYEKAGSPIVPVLHFEQWAHAQDVNDPRRYHYWEEDDPRADVLDVDVPSLTIVYDLTGWSARSIRAWAVQSGAKNIIQFWLSGEPEDAENLDWHRKQIEEFFPPKTETDDKVSIAYTYGTESGAREYDRDIVALDWSAIRRNYSAAALPQLDRLVKFTPVDMAGGKIGVLYGPPGTGKTHLIRALASEWKKWASVKYIMDVERFFGDPGYMLDVILSGRTRKKWDVILCEDAEEYISPGAKTTVGQGLSRLLNTGDGLIGQGLQLIFLFTTNKGEPQLHEAITRAGRCFMKVGIPLMTTTEATQWLGGPETVTQPISLADLYEIKLRTQIMSEDVTAPTGAYL